MTTEEPNLCDIVEQETSFDEPKPEGPSLWQKVIDAADHLQDMYFRPKEFEKDGKIYEKLGVKTYKKFLPTFGDYVNRFNRKVLKINAKFVEKSMGSLRGYEFLTRVYETAHISGFVFFNYAAIHHFSEGDTKQGVIDIAMNVLINVYPMMVQRYNRVRTFRALDKMKN